MRRSILLMAIIVGTAPAGCGADPEAPAPSASAPGPVASAQAELAAHAAAAKDLVGVSLYTLQRPGSPEGTVMVVRAPDGSWRVDVPGGALGGTVDVAVVAVADGRFQCTLPPRQPGCVRVDEFTPDIDARIPHVFTDWLDVLTDRAAPLAISTATPPPEVSGACYSVEPSAASLVPPVDAGIYCYADDGTLTGARLDLGALTLVSTDAAAPPTVELPGPVVDADPLPTASPPPPSATPDPTPASDPVS